MRQKSRRPTPLNSLVTNEIGHDCGTGHNARPATATRRAKSSREGRASLLLRPIIVCAVLAHFLIWRAHCLAAAVMEWRKERAAGGGEVKIVEVGGDFGMIEVAAEEALPEEGADALAAEAAGLAISPPGAEAAVADSSEAVGAVS